VILEEWEIPQMTIHIKFNTGMVKRTTCTQDNQLAMWSTMVSN